MDHDQFLKDLSRKKNSAFKYLYSQYYSDMVMYGLKFVDFHNTAEDIVQEVFLTFIDRNYYFKTEVQLKTFLYRSVRNSCLNIEKHSQVKKKYENHLKHATAHQESDDHKIIEQEVYSLLFNAINKLPERCRQIFELHLKGKKNEEIAQLMNISVMTVKTQKKIGMKFLRKELGDLFSVFF